MARHYRPKRRWKDPAKRAEIVVRLREKGMSMRHMSGCGHCCPVTL